MEFKLGAVASQPDHRDYIYAKLVGVSTNLPTSFFYDRIPVNKQVIGDCVGQSSRAIKYIQERKNYPRFSYDFAPDFIYSECKKRDGAPNDEGTQPKVAMDVLKSIGAAKKGLYGDLTVNVPRPDATQTAYEDAKQFQIGAYAKIQTLDEIKTALVNEGPVLGAVVVTDTFEKCEPGGFIPLGGTPLGGHAICIDGYDDNMTHTYADGKTRTGFLRFVNSWGEGWGDKGYGYLPYDFVTFRADIGLAFFQEAWSSVDVILPDKNTDEIVLWIDKTTATVNGQQVTLDQPPTINRKTNTTLVPLRFISENMGYDVVWDGINQQITIRKKG